MVFLSVFLLSSNLFGHLNFSNYSTLNFVSLGYLSLVYLNTYTLFIQSMKAILFSDYVLKYYNIRLLNIWIWNAFRSIKQEGWNSYSFMGSGFTLTYCYQVIHITVISSFLKRDIAHEVVECLAVEEVIHLTQEEIPRNLP